ncbi:hypothetical protein NG702_05575 [Pseudarthrobacter sp. MDT3-28]|uniref:TY-Chap2 family putative peptide chaperone n=1 Tax=Pseudarthrobacter raffinosi TaxID=2953651 RepID=UPI00208F0C84|nr:hypothetical protein [Pseudarthrobacter sp. MDT3-28]MCO4236897.1 hypothetical protein [Pseudarthrobacter sp. MDT3-28]
MPVESVSDDLLTLESAAVLTLVAKHGFKNLSVAISNWQLVEKGLGGTKQESAQIEGAFTALGTLLESTGLVLPSALRENRLTSSEAVMNEMLTIVQGPFGCENGPQAAVALLNVLCEKQLGGHRYAASLMGNGLVLRAWKHIYRFVHVLRSKPKHALTPGLKGPLAEDWIAHDSDLVGDNTPWSLGIGPLFQTLAGWDSTWLMAKGKMSYQQSDSISYWTPLPLLAIGPLGWSDPAVGVARWILMGMPDETPELSLLFRVWGADALMYFSHPQMDWIPQSHEYLGFELRTSGRRISEIYESRESTEAFSGCGGLHMQVHLQWQLRAGFNEIVGEAHMYGHEAGRKPKFVLELEKMAGWHAQLYSAGDKLSAEVSNPDIELIVVAPPVGSLGTFRRSRTTGLWYSGSHEAHLLGHSDLRGPLRRIPSTVGMPATSPTLASTPSMRHTSAIAFWLASELARRHPHYVLHGAGLDGLNLVSPAGPTIHISRHATVSGDGRELVGTSELFAAEDKQGLIGDLEERIGLPLRKHAAPTTERTVVYRTMAHIASIVIGDKAAWNLVGADSERHIGAWHLTRDGSIMALLTTDGNVRISGRTVNLLERYHVHGHRMTPMIGEVFGAVLP